MNKELPADARIRLDTATLETRASLYPPELRDPFVWLGSFVREECSRDLDILNSRARKLDIAFDKTTWSKILRGRWDRDAEDKPVPHPIVALPKLLKAIESLRKDSRIRAQGGRIPFVETGTALTIFDFIDGRRAPDRVCKFGVVVGETGSQKTASFREYCTRNNHGQCVWIEAPATPSMTQFRTDLAWSYGCSKQTSHIRKMDAILEAVNDKKTIIVDNIQRLHNPKLEGNQPVFNFLQKIQEDTGCTIILSFTPTFEKIFSAAATRGYFEQFEGRAGGARNFLRLSEYPPEEDVVQIAEAFGLRDAEKHAAYLSAIAHEPGRIRRLFEDLQQAKIEAEAEGKPLTIGLVRSARGED